MKKVFSILLFISSTGYADGVPVGSYGWFHPHSPSAADANFIESHATQIESIKFNSYYALSEVRFLPQSKPINMRICRIGMPKNGKLDGFFEGKCSMQVDQGVEIKWQVQNRLITRSNNVEAFRLPGILIKGVTNSVDSENRFLPAVFDLEAAKKICKDAGYAALDENNTRIFEVGDYYDYKKKPSALRLLIHRSKADFMEYGSYILSSTQNDYQLPIWAGVLAVAPNEIKDFNDPIGSCTHHSSPAPYSVPCHETGELIPISELKDDVLARSKVISVDTEGNYFFKENSPFVGVLSCKLTAN